MLVQGQHPHQWALFQIAGTWKSFLSIKVGNLFSPSKHYIVVFRHIIQSGHLLHHRYCSCSAVSQSCHCYIADTAVVQLSANRVICYTVDTAFFSCQPNIVVTSQTLQMFSCHLIISVVISQTQQLFSFQPTMSVVTSQTLQMFNCHLIISVVTSQTLQLFSCQPTMSVVTSQTLKNFSYTSENCQSKLSANNVYVTTVIMQLFNCQPILQ